MGRATAVVQAAGAGLSSTLGESGTPASYCRRRDRWTPAGPTPLRRPGDASAARAVAAVVVVVLVVLVLSQVVLVLGLEAWAGRGQPIGDHYY